MFEKPHQQNIRPTVQSKNLRKIDVFLRTCSRQGIICQGHRVNRPRCVGDDRNTMIEKCVKTLITAISNSENSVKLWVIDDHSSQMFLNKLHTWVANINCEIISTTDTGYLASAVTQAELCRTQGSDIVYLTEDDYLHDHNAIDLLASGLTTLQQSVQWHPVAIYPYDCIDRYKKEFPEPCRIFYHAGLYWRTITKSTPVLMMQHETFTAYYDIFADMAKNYDPFTYGEDQTINRLWSNMVNFAGPVVLFSPVPSLAVHLEHQEPTVISQGVVNWRENWMKNV